MGGLHPAAKLELLYLYPVERAALLDLLGQLKPDEWAAPTECPAWSVKGIALHLLGTAYMCAVVVRDMLMAERDPVRQDGSGASSG